MRCTYQRVGSGCLVQHLKPSTMEDLKAGRVRLQVIKGNQNSSSYAFMFLELLVIFEKRLIQTSAFSRGKNMKNTLTAADIIFKNGRVITVNPHDDIAQALAVKGNRIIFVGSDAEMKDFRGDRTEVIDLAGRTLMPGIIDSHFHPILAGLLGPGRPHD